MSGKLYIISTPIGNLEDISSRALDRLKNSNIILCEDTRKSGILLSHYQIKNKLSSFHSYNEEREILKVLDFLKEGMEISLITDGGTPGISDPGLRLIKKCIEHNIDITTIPGPNAIITAYVMSGFDIDSFYFEGFLPQKKGRSTKLQLISSRKEATIFFESPYRVKKLLLEMNKLCPNREIALCRELTKKFEEIVRGKIKELAINTKIVEKGEFTLVLNSQR